MKNLLLLSGVFILGALSIYARSPFLLNLRDYLPYLLLLAALLLCNILRKSPVKNRVHLFSSSVLALFILGFGLNPFWQAYRLEMRKQALFRLPEEGLQKYGRHLVVGYRSYPEVKRLVEKGMIGGIFIAPYNIHGKSFDQVQREIGDLQSIQREAGRAPLWIMSDQEGGKVSKLSPLIVHQPHLGELLELLPQEEWDETIQNYASLQAEQLARLGVNVNLSPVVDLKSSALSWDSHSRIDERAFSASPEVVAKIALAYSQTFETKGVFATLKHFPGLGKVEVDTHLHEGILGFDADFLSERDWLPFREVLAKTSAFLMLGHVRLQQIDAENPVSVSKTVVQEILRKSWGYRGILITDDFAMAPLYARKGGVGEAAVDALNAGVDLLLISYDGELYYEMMESLLSADREGKIDAEQVLKSSERLESQGNLLSQTAAIFQEE